VFSVAISEVEYEKIVVSTIFFLGGGSVASLPRDLGP